MSPRLEETDEGGNDHNLLKGSDTDTKVADTDPKGAETLYQRPDSLQDVADNQVIAVSFRFFDFFVFLIYFEYTM